MSARHRSSALVERFPRLRMSGLAGRSRWLTLMSTAAAVGIFASSFCCLVFLAPLRASLELFDEAGMTALRAKSRRLTAYTEAWVDHAAAGRIEILTPRRPDERGYACSSTRAAGFTAQTWSIAPS